MKRVFRSGEQSKEVNLQRELSRTLSPHGEHLNITIDGASYEVKTERLSDTEILLWLGPKPLRFAFMKTRAGELLLSRHGRNFTLRSEEPGRKRSAEHSGSLSSPMPGKVIRVLKAVADIVKKGEAIIVVEAMKMELPIRASRDGVIKAILCEAGEKVSAGAVLVELE